MNPFETSTRRASVSEGLTKAYFNVSSSSHRDDYSIDEIEWMSTRELIRAIQDGAGANANLADRDMQGVNFRNARLMNSALDSSNLEDADLQGADFEGATLEDTNLKNANLKNADFVGAFLIKTNLQGANLQNVSFFNARIQNVNMEGADLRGAKLSGSFWGSAKLKGVKYDSNTVWPKGFTPPGEGRMASRSRFR